MGSIYYDQNQDAMKLVKTCLLCDTVVGEYDGSPTPVVCDDCKRAISMLKWAESTNLFYILMERIIESHEN